MSRPFRLFLFLLVLCCMLNGSALADENENGESNAKYIWKLATLAPKNIGYALRVQEILIPEVQRCTDGELFIKVYWGGIMGSDEEAIKKMRVGQIQGAGLSGEGTFMLSKEISVLGLPFLFNSYDEVDYVKHHMFEDFNAIVAADQGMKMITWLDQDFDQIYTTRHPVATLEDFSKSTFITWFGPLEGKLLERLGTSATPMNVMEIPPSLRSNIAEGVIAPAIWVLGTQLYATLRYINPMKIRYVPAFPVVTQQAWDMLPAQYQANILERREEWSAEFNAQSRKDTEKCIAAMVRYGVVEAQVQPEDLQKIKDRAIPIWNELAGSLYSEEILEKVQAYLKEFRSQNPPG